MDVGFAKYYDDHANEFDFKKIGNRIRELRRKSKITQRQLASSIYKTESSIRKYEKGLTNIPINVLDDIAMYFNTTIYYLSCIDQLNENEIYKLIEEYDVPIWEVVGLKDASQFLDNTKDDEILKQYENIFGKDSLKSYIARLKSKIVMNDFKKTLHDNFVKNITTVLSMVGFTLERSADESRFILSRSDDINKAIYLDEEELFNLATDLMDYNQFKVNKVFNRLNDSEHQIVAGQLWIDEQKNNN